MPSDLPSGTVTFLFTDVEGSTKLLHELGAERYAEALAEHRSIVREACVANDGVEVDTQGDAFFVAFPTAPGAIAAAKWITDQLCAGRIQVRMGLHTGTPLLTGEGYVGEDVHFAARVGASSHGGQVVLSKATRDLIDPSFDLTDLGEHRLKDIEHAVQIFQLGAERFPPLKTISNTNLPRPASSFVGRENELGEVLGKLEQGARLLTLTGPGGSGKTRLALEAASTLVPDYKAGVFWVGLAALRDPSLVTEQIAQTLGAKDGLASHIAEREMLLLLDNLEQVVECAPELSELLQSCPNLTLLCTSRELLRVQGEVEYPVQPLASPEAVSLFCARSGLEATEEIAELCARLDNLPLAVELAAARTKALTPAQILERLSSRLDLLKGGRDADPRQQTLRATIAWSYDLLSEEEQRLVRSLSVFSGGCTLEAAEEVCDADLDSLQSLVEKSLLRFTDGRFWMLETIREYAGKALEASGETEQLQSAHADFFVAWAEQAAPQLRGPTQATWLPCVDREYDNLRTVIAWSLGARPDQALRLGAALRRYWWSRSYLVEGRGWLEQLLPVARSTRDEAAVAVFVGAGALAREQGDWEAAIAFGEEALEVAVALGESQLIAACHHELGIDFCASQSHFERARASFEEALRRRQEIGDLVGVSQTLNGLGEVALADGDIVSARTFLSEALDVARTLGDKEGIGGTLCNLALLSLDEDEGDVDLAWVRSALRESLALVWELGNQVFLCGSLEGLALAEERLGNSAEAARLLGAAAGLRETIGAPIALEEQARHDQAVSRLRGALGAPSFDRVWDEGRGLALEQVVVAALGECL
jgi:predicted ATPase